MWQVENHTPFATAGYFLRDRQGIEHWVVAMRATLDLRTGQLPALAPVQVPVRLLPLYDPSGEELIEDTDFAPFRPECDILLYGEATPPPGESVRCFPVTLSVGATGRRIYCHGPRRVTRTLFGHRIEYLGDAKPTSLSWRHATGGADSFPGRDPVSPHASNPIGTGWTADPKRMRRGDSLRLAPLDTRSEQDAGPGLNNIGAGFGAIGPAWQPRLAQIGTCDDLWARTRHPLPPEDFDDRFHQTAPAGQTAALRGGEAVHVENASRSGVIRFRIPQIISETRTRIATRLLTSRMRFVSLIIHAGEQRASLVWNNSVPCPGQDMQVVQSTVLLTQYSGLALT